MNAQARLAVSVSWVVLALVVGGCGSGSAPKAPVGVSQSTFERQLADAQHVSAQDLPAATARRCNSLRTPPRPDNRRDVHHHCSCAATTASPSVIDAKNKFVYGKTAVYVARTPDSTAHGPYPAPADSLLTESRYRSKQATLEAGAAKLDRSDRDD